jgi:hypothetical protein
LKTNQTMFVNNIGYTEFAFEKLGAKRTVPSCGPTKVPNGTEETIVLAEIPKETRDVAMSKGQNRGLKETCSELFMRKVADNEKYLYRLTVALAEMHLGTIVSHETQFAGILYPSVRMWANGDNLALLPWFVDDHLDFRKAVHIRIKGRTESSIDIDYLDAAREFDEGGKLKWLGRVQAWTLQPKQAGKFLGVAGPDDDGDCTIGTDGQPVHWEAEDLATGKPIHRS